MLSHHAHLGPQRDVGESLTNQSGRQWKAPTIAIRIELRLVPLGLRIRIGRVQLPVDIVSTIVHYAG